MNLQSMKILVVDDEEANLVILEGVLQRAGYRQVRATDDPSAVLELYRSFQPDLMILDFHMPHMNGLEVMEALAPLVPEGSYFPILMLTADMRAELRQKALASGAKDFLNKPLNAAEVRLRIRNLLEARYFHLQLQEQNAQLEEKVRQRTQQLEEAQIEMLVRLAKAAEFRDDESGEHIWRVARCSALLAQQVNLSSERAELLLRACRLH
ncbi:MAG TPA: response regulator, partial [Trueperaceae bacterium]